MDAILLTAVAAGYLLGLSGYFAALVSGRARSGTLGAAREVTPYLFLPLPVLVALAVFVRAPIALVLSVSALVFVAMALEPRHPLRRRPPGPPAGATSFRIVTLNAGGNAARGDAVSLERTVGSIDADVVALQELTPRLLAHLRQRFAGRYPHWHGSWPAVVFSRHPIRSGRCLRFPSPGSDAQRLEIEVGGRTLTLFNAHITRPGHQLAGGRFALLRLVHEFDPSARDAHIALITAQLRRTPPPCVVVGDLNATEWSEPYRMLTTTVVDSFAEAARRWGNTYRLAPSRRLSRLRFPFARIDYVLHSPDLVALRAEVGPDSASDHLPVVAELAFRHRDAP